MKYWKNGFYEAPQGGAVEITDEYWTELLDGQCLGKNIVEDENGMPVLCDPLPIPGEDSAMLRKRAYCAEADQYLTAYAGYMLEEDTERAAEQKVLYLECKERIRADFSDNL